MALIIGNMLFGFDPMVRMVAVCVASAGGCGIRAIERFCSDVHADRSDPLALKVGSSPNSICGSSYYDLPPPGRTESAQSAGKRSVALKVGASPNSMRDCGGSHYDLAPVGGRNPRNRPGCVDCVKVNCCANVPID